MAISLAESIRIGVADILARKVRTIVTVVGIVLGVMCIMVVLAIVKGMNRSTLDWMMERGGMNKVEVNRNWDYDFSKGGEATFTYNEMERIHRMIPEATAFNPKVEAGRSILTTPDMTYSGGVFGVMPDMVIVDDWPLLKGRFITPQDVRDHNNVIVLGSTVSNELFHSRDPLGQYVTLKGAKLMVVGVLSQKYWKNQGGGDMFGGNALEYMNRQSFLPISTLLRKIDPALKITSIDIRTSDPASAKALRAKVEGIVLDLKKGKKLFRVESAQEQMEAMKRNMMIFGAVFFLIAVISLLVGGIVIMNIMLASVRERTREIGVRMAVGARGFDIMVQFLVQTVLITGLGGILGIVFGWSILGLVGGYLGVTVVASTQMVMVAMLVAVGVGLTFGIAPALRASRLDPVTALREE